MPTFAPLGVTMALRDRLNPIETIMWRTGSDATLRMTVGGLILLDDALTREQLVERLAVVAEDEMRLRARLEEPSVASGRTTWVDRAEFDPAEHVRVMGLPAPGDERQLLDLVSVLELTPFDPDRSPWDVTLVSGRQGGGTALYVRAHHALTDGMGGVSLFRLLVDDKADGAAPPSDATASPGTAADGEVATDGLTDDEPASILRRPGTYTFTVDLTRTAEIVAERAATTLTIDPVDAVVRRLQRGLEVAGSLSRQVTTSSGPMSTLPDARSMATRFEILSIPHAKSAALALGGSRNDLLVAAAATALGAYHRRLGLPCPELRVAIPGGRRRDSAVAAGNWFAPTKVEIPTDAEHPGPHFGVVAERLARARQEPALRLSTPIASAVSRLPTRWLMGALHAQAASVDFAATAVPGLRGPRSVCGAAISDVYFFGPRLGRLMNITALGTDDGLDIGIALDATAIAEPDVLRACLIDAFQALEPAADTSPAIRRTKPRGGTGTDTGTAAGTSAGG